MRFVAALLPLALLAAFTADCAVYEVQITAKTTVVRQGKLNGNVCGETEKLYYRNSTTLKLKGVVWGDACDFQSDAVFWNETVRSGYGETSLEWLILDRIGAKGDKAETLLRLQLLDGSGETLGEITLAGQGSVKDGKTAKSEGDYSGSYISSLSGTVTGWLLAGQVVETHSYGCLYCGTVETTVYDALGWDVCGCERIDNPQTAVSGTWSLKYNSKASKKLDEGIDIEDAYAFPKYIK